MSDLHQGLDIDYSGLPKSVEQILGSHLWCTHRWQQHFLKEDTSKRDAEIPQHKNGDTEINILQGKSITVVIDPPT